MKTELIVIDPANALAVFTQPDKAQVLLAEVRGFVESLTNDVSTKKGRDGIASVAYKIARTKTAVDAVGKDLVDEYKEIPKRIDATRKLLRDGLDEIKDKWRQPLTDYEDAEKERISVLDERLNHIQMLKNSVELTTAYQPSATILDLISKLELIAIDESWQEYKDRAAMAKEAAKVELDKALQTSLTFEAQQAEIAMLKAKQEEKDRLQREEQIRINARHEAEQQAMRDKLAAEQREQEAKDAKERAEKQLEQERFEAAERQRVAVERAAEQERQRHLEEQKRIQYEAEQARIEADIKAADIEHQRAFNREVIADLLDNTPELTEQQAIKILTAIIRSEVRHISIQY